MEQPLAIVGIGASAGGIEALSRFFKGMPLRTGLAFIVVTHLARGHPSALREVIANFTEIPVSEAEDNQSIDRDHIYVCPPDAVLSVTERVIRLEQRTSDVQHQPIDIFLSSLGDAHRERAVGVLLSGAGTDGTLGIKVIKELGGLAIAQGGDGSKPMYSGMPDTAIAAGAIDLVLPAEAMANNLAEHAAKLATAEAQPQFTELDPKQVQEIRKTICDVLLKQTGHDFSGYKEGTFMRRVHRRMQASQLTNLERYLDRLQNDPEEVTLLFRDLLISVTNFFRDPAAFETLQETVVPHLFESKGANETLRVWVPGCATGEEVYSIAILLREYMEKLRTPPKLQIFATDIDESALAIARLGRYPTPLMQDVSPERLKRFFTGDHASVSVNKEIRDACIFSTHSIVRDPPFSRIDLISCRNLLIYFGASFQAQAIPVFHFSLRPQGYLFLGMSENVTQFTDLFTPVDKKRRIFQRRDHVVARVPLHNFSPRGRATAAFDPRRESGSMTEPLRRAVEKRLLESFAPAHVVVNRDGDILHYSPRTGKYLEPAAGPPSRHLIGMARRGLRLDLSQALREAADSGRASRHANVPVEIDDRVQIVDVIVEPCGDKDDDPLYLVLFNDVGTPVATQEFRKNPVGDHHDKNVESLEEELREMRERLHATVEEYETSVEELKSSNEEVQSVNEELQSSNEEMESTTEELQSVNEELNTVNDELRAKIDQVDQTNADMRNILDSTQIATVFLDRNLVIRTFTPSMTAIFNLISSDQGRPLTDIATSLEDIPDLKSEIKSVFDSGKIIERRVHKGDSVHYLMRILPYRGHGTVIEGALLTFIDVSTIVASEIRQRRLVEELNHRVRNMLTVVGSIAKQTLKSNPQPGSFTDAFMGRIQSMATAYTLVSRQNWGDVKLRDILVNAFAAVADEGGRRVELDGGPLAFKPPAALALGLVFHELITNAVKYGALSAEDGRVRVHWPNGDVGSFDITWEEHSDRTVKKPEKKGFGMELIERELKSALGAHAQFVYTPHGLTVRISIPNEEQRSSAPVRKRRKS